MVIFHSYVTLPEGIPIFKGGSGIFEKMGPMGSRKIEVTGPKNHEVNWLPIFMGTWADYEHVDHHPCSDK